MKQTKQIGRRVAAVLTAAALCAALCVTALALSPTLRENLSGLLGGFAPYSQSIEGAVYTDQGIEIQVLSALADDVRGEVYISVRDVEGDRLNEFLKLTGKLEIADEHEPTEEDLEKNGAMWTFSLPSLSLVSYDPESKTALMVSTFDYGTYGQPVETARLTASALSTTQGQLYGTASLASVSAGTLESLPLDVDDNMFFTPGDVTGLDYDDSCLPAERVVLVPEQNPMAIEGTGDIWISSMGFASDGCLHIRLACAEGVDLPHLEHSSYLIADLAPKEGVEFDTKYYVSAETQVAGGIDILFPLIHPENLAELDRVRFSGQYTRPGVTLEGEWQIEFPFEYMSSRTLAGIDEVVGQQVEQITVSPMTVTMNSIGKNNFFSAELYAVMKDGTIITGEPSTGSYNNLSAYSAAEEDQWVAYNTWEFKDPVELEQLEALELLGERIPVEWAP